MINEYLATLQRDDALMLLDKCTQVGLLSIDPEDVVVENK
jgi:hypothetical protein